jgi:hypothetical protein
VTSLFVWLAYLIAPMEGWGLFHGRPLGVISTATLAVACWIASARGSIPLVRIVAIALALKLLAGSALLLPRGFDARYYANAAFAGPIEGGTEPADQGMSRTDDRLRFGRERAPDLPLEFFNDLRFNYYLPTHPTRTALPFSVFWQGLWRAPTGGPQQLYVHSPGGAVEVVVGTSFRARVEPSVTWTAIVNLEAGFHPVTIALAVPQGGVRQFEAGRVVSGHEEPFDGTIVYRRRAGTLALAADAVVRRVSQAFDCLLCAWLLLAVVRSLRHEYRRLRRGFNPHSALAMAWAVGIADALIIAAPTYGRLVTLTGGDDWLTYEAQARDIGLHSWLMTKGAALGQGDPFYGQPLYSYFLAGCHWLFGDRLFGIYFVQRLFATATIVVLWRTVALLFDESAGLAALITAIVVVSEKFTPWSTILLTETLFVPLVCLWVYTLVRVAGRRGSTNREAVVAGVVGGLATLTRSSLLLAWAVVVPALASALGRSPRRWTVIALVTSAMMATTSLALVRNWIVAHKFVPISSEGSVVLFLGNPPPDMTIPAEHHTQYDRLGLDLYARAVVEYARQQPRALVRGLGRKALYTLGWFERLHPGAGTSAFYIATWMAALAGVVALWWLRPAPPLAVLVIPLLVAASHFAAVVLFLPDVYGDRLIMPFYMLIVPYAVVPIIAIMRRVRAFRRTRPCRRPR